MSPPLPKRGRVRLHVGYPISYGGHVIHGGQKKSSRGSEKRNERNSFYSPPLVGKSHGEDTVLWLEEIKARAGATTQLERYTPRSHTATVTHRGFIFRFHFPRAKAMWSKFSNQRMEPVYLLRAFVYTSMADGEQRGRVNSVFIRLFERNTHLSGEKGT